MKTMTIEEWGNAIYSQTFKVLYIEYDRGMTRILDTTTNTVYSVTYDNEKQKLILEKCDDQ
jgi:hypothetical protein